MAAIFEKLNFLKKKWILCCSSRKTPLSLQDPRKQADAQSRSQVSRQMLPIHCHAWTCLFIVTFECTSPTKRFPPKTAKWKEIPSNPTNTKKLNSAPTTKTKTNKYTRRLWCTWRTLLTLKNTKKLKYKLWKNKHTNDKDKNNQIHSQIKIHNEHLNNINNIDKYKKLNMMEHKTDRHEHY